MATQTGLSNGAKLALTGFVAGAAGVAVGYYGPRLLAPASAYRALPSGNRQCIVLSAVDAATMFAAQVAHRRIGSAQMLVGGRYLVDLAEVMSWFRNTWVPAPGQPDCVTPVGALVAR